MPKIYSDGERAYIKKRLKEEAAYLLSTFGIRRTTVDLLVDRVKIPKGTFYLFYKSKELLLFEVLMEQHECIEKQLFKEVANLRNSVTVDELTDILIKFFKATDETGLLHLITTGEIEFLYRKLPQDVVQQHFIHDTNTIDTIIEILSLSPKLNSEYFGAAFRNLFVSMVYKREIGEKYFDEALKLTIRGLVLQLLD